MILSEFIHLFNEQNQDDINDFSKFDFYSEFKSKFKGSIKNGELMKNHTTMRVGGLAPIFFEPANEESLVCAVELCKKAGVRFFVLGGGSNTILPEEIDFAIISTKYCGNCDSEEKIKFSSFKKNNEEYSVLSCSAGATWGQICNFCREQKILDFAPFSGLPGTVGGAIFMNASCFGFSTDENLLCVRYFDLDDFKIHSYVMSKYQGIYDSVQNVRNGKDDDWGYKKSPFQSKSNFLILSADFLILNKNTESQDEVNSLYSKYTQERNAKGQFAAPSAGSVFKNNLEKGIIAGKVIDECGLKGTAVGGAKIADWHGNFIINPERNATSKDIRELVDFIRKDVKKKKNIDLECEILFV